MPRAGSNECSNRQFYGILGKRWQNPIPPLEKQTANGHDDYEEVILYIQA